MVACHPKEEKAQKNTKDEKAVHHAIETEVSNYQFSFSSLKLHDRLHEVDLKAFKHFGEFYTEDFSIYRLERVDYLTESIFIDDINLYFIDSVLVKIQAYLREDRSSHLINRYGNAKISIDNDFNKKLLENEKILLKQNGKYGINNKLGQYTLKWIKDDADIFYQVNRSPAIGVTIDSAYLKDVKSTNKRFKLTVQTKDFDQQMQGIKWESYKESRRIASVK